MKLKGGMLYYTLFLMLISMSITTLLVLRGYLFNKTFLDNIKKYELERNVSSAFKIYSEGVDLFSQGDSCNLDLFSDSISCVILKKSKWGIYDLITATSSWKNLTISKSGLFGTNMDRGTGLALYLADTGINLSLSGNSLVKGVCYVPGGNVKSASIEGHPFIYKQTVEGQTTKSNKTLPETDTEVLKSILSLFLKLTPDFSLSDIVSDNTDILVNPFHSKLITYYTPASVVLSDMNFKDNIIIASAQTITIDNSDKLENVIVLARKIVVTEGFSGSFQGFALESINIGKNVHLKYPSALALVQDENRKLAGSNQSVTIGENSDVSGAIIVITEDNSGYLTISKNAVVYGQVYCAGSVNLSGSVFGSLFCNYFRFSVSRSIYTNHLLDANIDFSRLPSCFSGVDFDDQNPKKSLIKWVD